ncbi:NACHT domain-containing protein [Streptomyces sp. NPDC050388]|uniref:NACHT domain-containing protein n=1 Tax=Streptomyces sp. NPDC050388 TaxID=3155781 RepID=UPI003416C1F3
MDELRAADPARVRAVVVGIEHFPQASIWNLDGASDDALRFARWLRGQRVPTENIELLLAPLPERRTQLWTSAEEAGLRPHEVSSRDQIMRVFSPFEVWEGDVLYVYWGGHGVLLHGGQRALFCPDASLRDKRAIELKNLLEYLTRPDVVRFARQIFLVDTCAEFFEELQGKSQDHETSEPTIAPFPRGQRSTVEQVEQYVLHAAAEGQVARQDPVRRSGVFSEAVLAWLELHSPTSEPDMSALKVYVREYFSDQTEGGAPLQTPTSLYIKSRDETELIPLGRVTIDQDAGVAPDPSYRGGLQATDLISAVDELRKAMRDRLDDEIARYELEQPEPIKVLWSVSGRPVQGSEEAEAAEALAKSRDLSEVPELLRGLPHPQLVVLGAPGSGKSVLTLLLARKLIDSWRPGDPVPVVLSLSSWRPRIKLQDWMARHIAALSPALGRRRRWGEDLATALVDSKGSVMPILDGLDELPVALHRSAVEAIDKAIAADDPLVVTCRTDEYQSTAWDRDGCRLTKAAVVELEPVQPEAAVRYLERRSVKGDERWNAVFKALRTSPELRTQEESALVQVLSSPLMLYLAHTAYRSGSTDPRELLKRERFSSQAEIESHLLKTYLPTIYAESPDARYEAEKSRRYLSVIARQMQRDGTFDFAWWQLNSPISGALVGAAFGSVWGWFFYVLLGQIAGIFAGLAAGTAARYVHEKVRQALGQVYITEDTLDQPRATLARYLRIGCLSALLTVCITAATVGGLLNIVGVELRIARDYALLVGVTAGSATLVGSAWGSYRVSHALYWLTGGLPPRLTSFLDDAHDLGVLRRTGVVYQFRHARLQEQLSGTTQESTRSAYTEKGDAGRLAFLLHYVPSVTQVILATVGIFIAGWIYVFNFTDGTLSIRSGDQPSSRVYPGGCNECKGILEWTWKLPPGSSRYATLELSGAEELDVVKWGGVLQADGCANASAQVILAMGDRSPVSVVLNNDPKGSPLHGKPTQLGKQPLSITLRRLDDRPCDLSVDWFDPKLEVDAFATARNRLAHAEPIVSLPE